MVERNAGQRLAHQVQYPIRDNRADLRPRASDHAGKHFDVRHTCQAQAGYIQGVPRGNQQTRMYFRVHSKQKNSYTLYRSIRLSYRDTENL